MADRDRQRVGEAAPHGRAPEAFVQEHERAAPAVADANPSVFNLPGHQFDAIHTGIIDQPTGGGQQEVSSQ
jgi:hypothetical protein